MGARFLCNGSTKQKERYSSGQSWRKNKVHTIRMSFLRKITGKVLGDTLEKAGGIVDNLTVSDDEKSEAKAKLTSIVTDSLNTLQQAQAEVLKTELSGNWLQRSWRPLTILTFVLLLCVRWLGLTNHHIDISLEMRLMDIIELSLGGYVIGRSLEKVTGKVTENIDISFIKKRNR